MKFEKVVFVRYFPITEAVYNDFYFEDIISNNIEVEYLDVTNLFCKKHQNDSTFKFSGTITISSYSELNNYCLSQDNQATLYISIMTYEWRIVKLFRIFTRHKAKMAVFARGVFPSIYEDKKSTLLRYFKSFSFQKLKLFTLDKISRFLKKVRYIKPYDFIFKAGEYGYWGLGIGSEIDIECAQIINLNTVDYDRFLESEEAKNDRQEKAIIFLDQYLPYHPDAAFLNIKPLEDVRYFKELNSYFDLIESQMAMKVIIAAHPKAMRYMDFNPFEGREIFFNKSNDLVKDAAIVLTHASTAICFPICYEKIIGLLMSEYIDELLPHFTLVAKSVVKACGATIIQMDTATGNELSHGIDRNKYNDFKYKYLTSVNTEKILSKEIFIKFLVNP